MAIDGLKENNFQDFMNELLIKKYGINFTPIRPKKDKGGDGILYNTTIIQAYAPNKPDRFKKKIEEDYEKYKENWMSKYPKWCIVFNGQFTAGMLLSIDELDRGIKKCDINHILELINSLRFPIIREIARDYLRIDEEYIINDVLKKIIDDLLKDNTSLYSIDEHLQPPYIEDKVKLNYSEEDIQGALNEYKDMIPDISKFESVLKCYEDEDIKILKNKVTTEYSKLVGDFKTRLNNLNELFAERNKNDDRYKYAVRVVLIYFFETCKIGKKTSEER
ncbi:MAG: hypothetical protein Q8N08_04130 [Methanobacteriaceae archaeon]|nr:hypothetical protein [Methanobacteriaceae archaeon]